MSAHASTLDDVISKKKVTVGVVTDYPPFSFLDSEQKPDGYEVEVAKMMGAALGVEVEFVPLTAANRIPYLLSGKIDAIFAIFGITPDRAKQVAYSNPYGTTDIVVYAPKSTEITSPEDLKGKRVSVGTSSTEEAALVAVAPPDTNILRFDTTLNGVQALLTGQVDAHAGGSAQLPLFTKARPDLEVEIKLLLRRQYNGIAVRRGDGDLLRWINTWLFTVKNNGELSKVYEKWMGTPLPDLPSL
jgi:polar amino acid transport system substrate-binding protein